MDVFCVIPYHCFETDEQSLDNIGCCRWPRGTSISDVQHSIKNGIRHPACKSCWRAEDAGVKSERQIHNETLDWILDKDIERIQKDALAGNTDTYMVKLYPSNLCNGQCVTCGPSASTAWQELLGTPITYSQQDTTDANIDWATVKYLSLVGGEPLLEKRNWRMLNRLAEQGITDIFVTIVTNATVKLSEQQKHTLKQFKTLNLCVSMDGTERVYEYMRYPAVWSEFVENVNDYKTVTDNLSASVMISAMNIKFIDQTLDWLDNNSIPYTAKVVYQPAWAHPGVLTNDMLIEVLNDNPKHAINYIDYSKEFKFVDLNATKKRLHTQDTIKGISIADYLGDWGKYFE